MQSFEALRKQGNAAAVGLLLVDVDLAQTLLDLARDSQDREFRDRRIHEAEKAYRFIEERIPTVVLTPKEAATLGSKMDVLKQGILLFRAEMPQTGANSWMH